MTAVENDTNKYIRASLSESRHGLFSFGSGLNMTHTRNETQMSSPGMPSSSMIRPYSFSIETEFFSRSCRKYGILVPPLPSPLPIGYFIAASKKDELTL